MGSDAGSAADRHLVEDAVAELLRQAPPDWVHLQVEFPSGQDIRARVTRADSKTVPLEVPAGVRDGLCAYQVRAGAAENLVIDCHADGRLSVRTDTDRVPRWPRWALATITLGCAAAAALIFAVGWRSSPPPRAAMIEVPAPSERQRQVFEVMRRWYDAENRADGPALRALACARPGKYIDDEIKGFEQSGNTEGITYFEAIGAFRDEGQRVWGNFVYRVRPISERTKQDVAKAQLLGGFFDDAYTLVLENGEFRVCDADRPPRQ